MDEQTLSPEPFPTPPTDPVEPEMPPSPMEIPFEPKPIDPEPFNPPQMTDAVPAPDADFAARMTELMSPDAQTMAADMRTCVVCGREFDAQEPNARCDSRPNVDSACCPHPYCNANSVFRGE